MPERDLYSCKCTVARERSEKREDGSHNGASGHVRWDLRAAVSIRWNGAQTVVWATVLPLLAKPTRPRRRKGGRYYGKKPVQLVVRVPSLVRRTRTPWASIAYRNMECHVLWLFLENQRVPIIFRCKQDRQTLGYKYFMKLITIDVNLKICESQKYVDALINLIIKLKFV